MKRTAAGSLVHFFVLTYALMWAFFIPVAVARIPVHAPSGAVLLLLGAFAPSLVAVWLTARCEGRAGVRALLGRVFQWKVAARWYVFAAGYIAAIKLAVALVHRIATGAWPRFGDEPWYLIVAAIAFWTPFQAGEEIGWRGYALPRMAARFGFGGASILLGLIWAFWHLPQFFIPGYGQSFPLYVVQVTAVSVAFTWLYANTGGSLLPVMLLHSAHNNAKDIVPSAIPGATNPFALNVSAGALLTVTLLWICASYFLATMPRRGPGRDTACSN